MNRLLITLLFSVCVFFCAGQKTEWNIKAGSGLYFFSGASAASQQTFYEDASYRKFYSNPYGKRPGLCITAGVSLQHVAVNKLLIGAEVSVQRLSANSAIDSVMINGITGAPVPPNVVHFPRKMSAQGESRYKALYFSITPFAGRRFLIGNGSLNITGGLDLAFALASKEHINVEGISGSYHKDIKEDVDPSGIDIRLRVGMDWSIKRFIVSATFAKGLLRYHKEIYGENLKAYSNLIGLGLGYRLK